MWPPAPTLLAWPGWMDHLEVQLCFLTTFLGKLGSSLEVHEVAGGQIKVRPKGTFTGPL